MPAIAPPERLDDVVVAEEALEAEVTALVGGFELPFVEGFEPPLEVLVGLLDSVVVGWEAGSRTTT